MKKKKLKLKKKNVIIGMLLLFSTIDFIYLLINMIKGSMLTWWGVLTLVIDIIVMVLTSEELKNN